jgi:hypothetical protein
MVKTLCCRLSLIALLTLAPVQSNSDSGPPDSFSVFTFNFLPPEEAKSLLETAIGIAGNVGTVIGLPSTISSAITWFLTTLGLIESAQQQILDQFNLLNQHLDADVSNLVWFTADLDRRNELALMTSAAIAAKHDLAGGQPIAYHSHEGDQSRDSAVKAATNPDLYKRHIVAGSDGDLPTDGKWKSIIDTRPSSKNGLVDENSLVYDWRVGIPWLTNLISMRLAIIGAIDPNFALDRTFDDELEIYKSSFYGHYQTIMNSLVCDGKYELHVNLQDLPANARPYDPDFNGDYIVLESAEFSATFWRPVTCAHSRRATVR